METPVTPAPGRRKRFANDLRFVRGWLKKPKTTGSIKPTGRSAAALMASFVDPAAEKPVLELGPGTGPITRAILETGLEPEKLTCVEYNDDFCAHLHDLYPGVDVRRGDAFNLDATLGQKGEGRFSAVLSGLPLLNFPKNLREKCIRDGLRFAEPGAPFVQLCYGPKAPVEIHDSDISCEPTKWVLANVPPARFWVYRTGRTRA